MLNQFKKDSSEMIPTAFAKISAFPMQWAEALKQFEGQSR
jgi:hypothetical protein